MYNSPGVRQFSIFPVLCLAKQCLEDFQWSLEGYIYFWKFKPAIYFTIVVYIHIYWRFPFTFWSEFFMIDLILEINCKSWTDRHQYGLFDFFHLINVFLINWKYPSLMKRLWFWYFSSFTMIQYKDHSLVHTSHNRMINETYVFGVNLQLTLICCIPIYIIGI